MSTILISLTEEEFREHVYPYLSKAKHGYESSIPLYKVFNYILYRLHTGRQWEQIAIDAGPGNLQKRAWWPATTTMPTTSSHICNLLFGGSSSKAYLSRAHTSMPTGPLTPRKLAKPVSITTSSPTFQRTSAKRGRERIFNEDVYKHRFTAERSFAWMDKYRALLIRFDRRELYFLNEHYIAFAMINTPHLVPGKG